MTDPTREQIEAAARELAKAEWVDPSWFDKKAAFRAMYEQKAEAALRAAAAVQKRESMPRPTGSHLAPGYDDPAAAVQERTHVVVPIGEAERIAHACQEYGGWWHSCSGCHETNEGYSTGHYPYDQRFKCEMGAGCNECGGLGVVWQIAPTEEECRAMLAAVETTDE